MTDAFRRSDAGKPTDDAKSKSFKDAKEKGLKRPKRVGYHIGKEKEIK